MQILEGIFVVSVLCPLVFAKEWVASRNGRGDAIRCYEDMLKDGDISNLLIDVTTPDKIDEFCRRYTDLQKCVADYEHYLSNEENTKYLQKTAGIHTFYLNVCPPGTDLTSGYKGNSPCFKLIKNEILSCGSDLPDMENYKMINNAYARCCALQTHRECLKRVTSEHCGQEAASVVEKIVNRYFEPQLKGCSGDKLCSPYTTIPHWSPFGHKSTTPNRRTTYPTTRHTETEEDWTMADEWKRHKKNAAPTITTNLFVVAICSLGILSFRFF